MKKHLFLFLLMLSVLLSGCKHSDDTNSLKIKDMKFVSMDLKGVRAMAVMKTLNGRTLTRAGEAPVDRLCVVDEDGNIKIASLVFEIDANNGSWRSIIKSIYLVPERIVPISNHYVFFESCSAECEIQEGATEASIVSLGITPLYLENGSLVYRAYSMEGGYLLRLSDGALFRSPVTYLEKQFRVLRDGRMVLLAGEGIGMIFLSDKGDKIDVSSLPLQELLYNEGNVPLVEDFFRLSDGTIFFLTCIEPYFWENYSRREIEERGLDYTGAWSFNDDLKPYFLDFSDDLKLALRSNHLSVNAGFEDYLLTSVYNRGTTFSLFKLKKEGDLLDCELIHSATFNSQYDLRYTENDVSITDKGDKITIYGYGFTAYICLSESSLTVEPYPDGFPGDRSMYDSNGRACEPGMDQVVIYNLNDKTKRVVDVKWDTVSCGKLVSGQCYYNVGDYYYTIKGKTRDAANVVLLVEIETGNVSLTELTEFSGSVVTSYYRLN